MAGRLVIPQYMPAEDGNGDPIPGAKMFVYVNLSATPALTFTTSALSVANPNPLIANSSGVFPPIWMADGSIASVSVTTNAGAPLVAYDDVTVTLGANTAAVILAESAAISAAISADEAEAAAALAEGYVKSTVIAARHSPIYVGANKTLIDANGDRFIVKGATMFDYLFSSFEPRTDWSYRKIYQPVGKGPGTGISEPTYYGATAYVSEANVKAQIARFKAMGGNLIRVSVEPACALASVYYVDPSNGLTYPPDLVMLDKIVEATAAQGIVCYLTMNNEQQYSANGVAAPDMISFLQTLIARYAAYDHVWLCPANEMNSTPIQASNGTFTNPNPNVSNATTWITKAAGYVAAIRAAGFTGPIGLNPTEYGYNLALVAAGILANATLANDPNLIIDIHQYSTGADDFYLATGTAGLANTLVRWANYAGQFCLMVGEAGINNNLAGGANLDPNLNGASADPALWAKLQIWVKQFLEYASHFSEERLSGLTGHMWQGYIPSLAIYDNNVMMKSDGVLTTWGGIFRDYYLAPAQGYLLWTPTFTPASGSFTSLTPAGRYYQFGKTVYVYAEANIVNNGTASGAVTLIPPIPSKHRTSIPGGDIVSGYGLQWLINPTAPFYVVKRSDGSDPQATGRVLELNGTYEAA